MGSYTVIEARDFGCEHFGRLRRVLLHRPQGLDVIDGGNYLQWQFDRVPEVNRFIEEHDQYRALLTRHGVQVLELADYVEQHHSLLRNKPNLTYLHDIAAVSSKGAFLSSMVNSRKGEELAVGEALRRLGIPILTDFDPEDAFEGCLLLSPQTLLVAETERHSRASIEKFISKALGSFPEVIYADIPKARRYMHPDTIFNRVTMKLALAYLPAFQATVLHTRKGAEAIDFERFMTKRGVEIVNVSDSEQARLACSFVPLEPGVIFHYDTALDAGTRRKLSRKGVEIIFFHPEAMVAGGGSLRCLTLRLSRAMPTQA